MPRAPLPLLFMPRVQFLFAFCLFLSSALDLPRSAILSTIRNDVPRVDQFGHIVNAHDGSVVQFNDTWFMYGTVYGNCTQPGSQCASPCGYSPNTYSLYTSPDLMNWTLQTTNILPWMTHDNAHENYWMPVVAYNKMSGKYAMQFWSTHCGFKLPCTEIAFSDSPYGPFGNVTTIQLVDTPSSQMGFFVDDTDGSAYIKFNTVGPTQHHAVQKLTADWNASSEDYAIIFWKPSFAWMEGGGLFKRGDLFYYMTGTDCCFCTWGGDAHYWTAYSPLGPWHPGIAPPLPTATCDVTGDWMGVHGSPDSPAGIALHLSMSGSSNFTYSDAHGQAVGWLDQATGFVTFPPSQGDHRGVITSADGKSAGCDRIRWYGYESFIWCRVGSFNCTIPSLADSPQLNYCQDGTAPHEDVRINPCDPGVEYGLNFTVPAQQFNVINTWTTNAAGDVEKTVLYYGERANSAPDRLFSHNFQAWVPLSFGPQGEMLPMTFPPSFQLNLSSGPL
jgi:hypothetical protein